MSQIDLNGLTSGYSEYMSTTVSNAAAEKLKSVASADYSGKSDDELMKVCKEFESYFLEQVFKEMNKTLQRLVRAVKYTSLTDVWNEISGNQPGKADIDGISKESFQRWRTLGKTVRP